MKAHINGTRIFFDVVGSGLESTPSSLIPKPTIFVHHGGPGADHSSFRPWLDALDADAQVVFLDHRGTGRSDPAPPETYTIEQLADDIEALRIHLGVEKPVLLGHSFGGMVAQVYALRHPDSLSGLILSNTAPSADFWEGAQERVNAIATLEQQELINRRFAGTLESPEDLVAWTTICEPLYYFHAPSAEELLIASNRVLGGKEVSNHMMAHAVPAYDVREELGSITVPTLVLAGRHDWVTAVDQTDAIAEGIPGSTYVVFENSGHHPFVEQTEDYIATIREFMTRIGGNGVE